MPPTTELDNRVTLNGVQYAIRGGVRAQPASDFQAGLRIGSPELDDRSGAFIISLEDTSGGLGILNAVEAKNEHMRPRFATAETRFPKLMTLGPKVTSFTLSGVSMNSVPIGKMRQWKDVLIIALGNKVYKLTSALTSPTDITPTNLATEVGTSARVADLLTHDFNDGFFANNPAMLLGFSGTGAGGTTRQYYVAAAADPVAASWSAQGDLSPGFELVSMVSFDQKVLAIQGAICKESNEGTTDTWGDLAVSPFDQSTFMEVPLHSTFIGTHRVPFGPDFMPWLLLGGLGGYRGRIAPMDYWARQFKPLELNIGRINEAFMMDDGIVVSNSYDLWKLIPSDPPSLRPMGLRREQGLPSEFQGAVVSGIGSMSGELVCGLTNLRTAGFGRIWIMQHNGAGWHVRSQQAIDNAIVLDIAEYEKPADFYGWRSVPYLCWLTWDGTNAKIHFVQEPIGNASPEQDATYLYDQSSVGVYETPWMYGGHEDLFGALLRLKCRAQGLSSTETIVAKYRLDDDDSSGWTTLGTFNNSTTTLFWGTNGVGVQFKSVRFRFEFNTGNELLAPKVRSFTLIYDKKPVTRWAYTFTVDAARMINEQDGQAGTWSHADDFQEVLTNLIAAKDSYVLVPFTYDNLDTKYVKVLTLPTAEDEIHDSMRRGVIQVQVSEIVT